MMKISASVCKYFDGCEIIEMHHDQKKDAPSGTATQQHISYQKKKILAKKN
jgi:4-hydroxy-tetrahydrodipicolinate reductase